MSTLWLVATPIGNLGDLAPRAISTLESVAVVCCEDTRRTGKLLQHAGIRAERLAVCNEHTEFDLIDEVLDVLSAGRDVAVVSDAGTPGISDPGERLVVAAVRAGHNVSAVPGPAAATMAVTISAMPADRYVYEGFLPRKGQVRAQRLSEIASERRTVVLYEAPHRLERTLHDLRQACGDDRAVSISRELTKLHEETIRGTLASVDVGEPRGEYVIVLGAPTEIDEPATDHDVVQALRQELAGGASTRDAASTVAERLGRRRREVYNLAHEIDAVDPASQARVGAAATAAGTAIVEGGTP